MSLPFGAGLAAVRLPAPERQVLVDLLVGAAEGGERDVAGHLVGRQELGVEERLLEGRLLRRVHLAEAAGGGAPWLLATRTSIAAASAGAHEEPQPLDPDLVGTRITASFVFNSWFRPPRGGLRSVHVAGGGG